MIDDKIKEDERERKRKRSKSRGRKENANRISLMDRSDMEARRIRELREQERHQQQQPIPRQQADRYDKSSWGDGPELTRAPPKRLAGTPTTMLTL